MNYVTTFIRKVAVVALYIIITVAVPSGITMATLTNETAQKAVTAAIVETDVSPVFLTFDGKPTPAYSVLFKNLPFEPATVMPVLNTPELKQCAIQYATGIIAQLHTGSTDRYPSASDVETALANTRRTLEKEQPINDFVWDNIVNSCAAVIYPPEKILNQLKHDRDTSIPKHMRNAISTTSSQSLIVSLGIILGGSWILMSICSCSLKKGMKHTGSALKLGGVIAVIFPAIAYFCLRRYDSSATVVLTETLYYGRFITAILKPVIKTIGIASIACIVSGAVLENAADRSIVKDRITDKD